MVLLPANARAVFVTAAPPHESSYRRYPAAQAHQINEARSLLRAAPNLLHPPANIAALAFFPAMRVFGEIGLQLFNKHFSTFVDVVYLSLEDQGCLSAQ